MEIGFDGWWVVGCKGVSLFLVVVKDERLGGVKDERLLVVGESGWAIFNAIHDAPSFIKYNPFRSGIFLQHWN